MMARIMAETSNYCKLLKVLWRDGVLKVLWRDGVLKVL